MRQEENFRFLSFLYSDILRFGELFSAKKGTSNKFIVVLTLFSPRFLPVLLCRLAYALYRFKLSPIAKIVSLINFVFFGIEISYRTYIGPGLVLPHTQGTVIGAESIGNNAIIFQGVTVGAAKLDVEFSENARPIIGDNINIGAGAKLLGGICIGDNVTIGANSVVLESVRSGVLVVGIPAKEVQRSK